MWYIQGSQIFPVFTISFHHSKEVFVCCHIVSLRCVFWVGLSIQGGGNDSPRPASQRAAALVLTAAMLTTLTAPAFAKEWYIEEGDITVRAGETEGTNKVSQGENPEVEDTNTVITNSDKDKASSNTVTIEAKDKDDKVEVTLKDVNIDTSSRSEAAVSVTGEGNTNIELDGDNALKSDIYSSGISSSGSLTISGGENDSLTAQGGSGADGIYSSGSLTISGGTVNAAGGNGKNSNGGSDGIISNDIDLSGSLELTAKAGRPNGKAISWAGHELDLDTIKDKLGPGAKVTATDANGETKQVSSPIPRPVEPEEPEPVIPEESSSSSDGGSATPSAPASPLPGLTVTDKDGQRISYTSIRGNNVLSIRVGRFTASLRVSLAALRQLRAEGIDTITFQTILCSTTLSVDELLAMGGEDAEAVLTHRLTASSLTVD